MRLGRVFFFVILFGSSAFAAYAQTPVDPKVLFSTPDPSCTPPYCVDLEYVGSSGGTGTFFFEVASYPTGIPEPPAYSCGVIDTQVPPPATLPSCKVNQLPEPPLTPTDFFGITLTVPDITNGQTFSITVDGGPVNLILPTGVNASGPLDCTSGCGEGGGISLDPTPEPGTALLFVSGLIGVVGFARKRFGTNFHT